MRPPSPLFSLATVILLSLSFVSVPTACYADRSRVRRPDLNFRDQALQEELVASEEVPLLKKSASPRVHRATGNMKAPRNPIAKLSEQYIVRQLVQAWKRVL